jgi:hypothetical protein
MNTTNTPDFDDDENKDLPDSDDEEKNEGDLNQFEDTGASDSSTSAHKPFSPEMKGQVENHFRAMNSKLRGNL